MEQDPDSGPPETSAHHQTITTAPAPIAGSPPALDSPAGAQDRSHTDTHLLHPEILFAHAPSPADAATALHDQSPPAESAASASASASNPLLAAASASHLAHDALPVTPIDPDDFYKSYRLTVGASASAPALSPADEAAPSSSTSPAMTSALAHQPILPNGSNTAGIPSHADGLVAQPSRGPSL